MEHENSLVWGKFKFLLAGWCLRLSDANHRRGDKTSEVEKTSEVTRYLTTEVFSTSVVCCLLSEISL
jgi:hypothetical protein